MHDWFESTCAVKAGASLAAFFVARVVSQPVAIRERAFAQEHGTLQEFLDDVDRVTNDLRLNAFKKRKLLKRFKWELLDKGVDKKFVGEITEAVLLRLRRNSESKVSPVSGIPASVDEGDASRRCGDEHLQKGALEEAIACYRKAFTLDPSNAYVHNNLGVAFYAQNKLSEAETCFQQAVAHKPDYAHAHNNLGNTLRIRGQVAASEASLRRALELKPDYADAFHNLGVTLSLLGRLDKAESSFQHAVTLDPNHAEALVAMGEMASLNGLFEQAESFFQRALAIRPGMPSAWSAIVGLRKMTPEDCAWLTTAEEIVRSGLHPLQESRLRFAMGKYCDDVNDSDRAFQNYCRANDLLKPIAEKYDRKNSAQFVDDMMQVFSRERLDQLQQGASPSARPIFVVGMMRSGTSLIEQIIASHPAAVGAGELSFWGEAFTKHGATVRGATLEPAMLHASANEYLRLLSGFSPDAIRIVDKMPGNFAYLGLIHSAYPHARIIHMRRNPVATCLSIYSKNFSLAHNFANDLADLAHYYRQYHRLMAHWRAVLPSEVFMDVPYEDLVGSQQEWTRKILNFVGLDWDDRCLNFQKTERRVASASCWQVRQKMYTTAVERWRSYEKDLGPLIGLMDLV
jgi:tetratricopeptide (TPR) repeat protein